MNPFINIHIQQSTYKKNNKSIFQILEGEYQGEIVEQQSYDMSCEVFIEIYSQTSFSAHLY